MTISMNFMKGKLIGNSFWAIVSSFFQNIIYSLFFIVIARTYSTTEFSSYIIANTLYGMVMSFSSLGLSQWFIREIRQTDFRSALIVRFFKIQIVSGAFFYLVNILLCYFLYEATLVRNLSLLLGINILFDNIIYVFKTINISQYHQKRSFVITSIEALLKLFIAFMIFYSNMNLLFVVSMLIALRFLTLYLFLRYGLVERIDLRNVLTEGINFREMVKVLYEHIYFVIIGSVSVIYWSVGSLIASKMLHFDRVADYEISFKLFSMAEIVPVMVSASVFPILVDKGKTNPVERNSFFKKIFFAYTGYGLLVFTFIYSYAGFLIPNIFGEKYIQASAFCVEMFLTIIIFPTALLQANLLVSMNMEKTDMWLNLLSLFLNVFIALLGLYFIKQLSVINYAIFVSFLCFHIAQDILLVRAGVTKISSSLIFYGGILFLLLMFHFISISISSPYIFFIFWIIMLVTVLTFYRKGIRAKSVIA